MKPYFEDKDVQIYLGDCRDILPSLPKVDLVLTDPPYGTGHYETDIEVLSPTLLHEWADASTVAIFGWPERLIGLCVAASMVPQEWVTWWPTNGACRGTNRAGLWREVECIAVFGRHRFGELRQPRGESSERMVQVDYKRIGTSQREGLQNGLSGTRHLADVWRDPSPGLAFLSHLRQHPNEKPITLLRRLIEGIEGSLILDPFMGSGTTLRAAKDLGRKAIGIEIEERYCEIAAKRMAQGVLI